MKTIFERSIDLLRRYRNETPLGNQPHMIAHEVDEILERGCHQSLMEKYTLAVEWIRRYDNWLDAPNPRGGVNSDWVPSDCPFDSEELLNSIGEKVNP